MTLEFSLLIQRRDEKRMTLVTFGMSLFQQFFISSFFMLDANQKQEQHCCLISKSNVEWC
jgi:hypothetical protein